MYFKFLTNLVLYLFIQIINMNIYIYIYLNSMYSLLIKLINLLPVKI